MDLDMDLTEDEVITSVLRNLVESALEFDDYEDLPVQVVDLTEVSPPLPKLPPRRRSSVAVVVAAVAEVDREACPEVVCSMTEDRRETSRFGRDTGWECEPHT